MNTATLNALKSKAEEAKNRAARIEGQIDAILTGWKTTYGFETVEEANQHLEVLKERKKSLGEKASKAMEQVLAQVPEEVKRELGIV